MGGSGDDDEMIIMVMGSIMTITRRVFDFNGRRERGLMGVVGNAGEEEGDGDGSNDV